MRSICGIGGLRDSKSGFFRAVGQTGDSMVPHRRILLRFPPGRETKNRCGICGRIMAPAGWAQAGRSGCGSVGGQLYRSFAAHGFAGAESGQRCAVGHPCDSGDAQREKKLILCSNCADCLREMELYCWEEGAVRDVPRKEHDHAMDEMRYFAAYLAQQERGDGFYAAAVVRRAG